MYIYHSQKVNSPTPLFMQSSLPATQKTQDLVTDFAQRGFEVKVDKSPA